MSRNRNHCAALPSDAAPSPATPRTEIRATEAVVRVEEGRAGKKDRPSHPDLRAEKDRVRKANRARVRESPAEIRAEIRNTEEEARGPDPPLRAEERHPP